MRKLPLDIVGKLLSAQHAKSKADQSVAKEAQEERGGNEGHRKSSRLVLRFDARRIGIYDNRRNRLLQGV